MKTKVKFLITLIGFLIGAVSYWRTPYKELNLLDTQMWILFVFGTLIGSFILNLYLNNKPIKVAILISLGVVLSVIFRILYEITFMDTSSHNLAPFEILVSVIQTLPMSLLGAYLGKTILKLKK
ncbi:hypothetical protein [Aegicerativicinus sediminis]|uniref:hypothetical protein n=1 Tax=Aegicerativicinus sediminis TaxID=2893202 RepID=UPI001E3D7377|nr:hypothetical protein [Aegicerativicinus sediminis]